MGYKPIPGKRPHLNKWWVKRNILLNTQDCVPRLLTMYIKHTSIRLHERGYPDLQKLQNLYEQECFHQATRLYEWNL